MLNYVSFLYSTSRNVIPNRGFNSLKMGQKYIGKRCPPSLVHLCCIAIGQDSAQRCIQLGTIISIPEANIAQKLFEVCNRKSVVIIKKKATFADGCYVKVIACGYHLGRREFLFGHYMGLRQKNIATRFKWFYSMNIRGNDTLFFHIYAIF